MITDVECVTRRWGGSIGVIIPREIARKERLVPNEHILVSFKKTPPARMLWEIGPLQIPESTQRVKDELRKGW